MAEITFTESRPSEVLAALHESAADQREFLFSAQDASTQDLIVVAWTADRAVGYLAASDERPDAVLVWEHLVVPDYRGRGIGRRLLVETAKRAPESASIVIDPLGTWALDQVSGYYGSLGFPAQVTEGQVAVLAADVLSALGERDELTATVAELLSRKPPGVVTVDPEAEIRAAVELMNELRIGAVVASTDGSRVEGILSERDVMRSLVATDDLLGSPVRDHMSIDVATATPTDSVVDVMDTMTSWRIRHMPVTQAGRLVGILSVGDLLLFRLEQLDTRGGTLSDRRSALDAADRAANWEGHGPSA